MKGKHRDVSSRPDDDTEQTAAKQTRRKHLHVLGSVCLGTGVAAVTAVPGARFVGYPLTRSTEKGSSAMLVGRSTLFEPGVPVRVDLVSERIDAWNRFPDSKLGAAWVIRGESGLSVLSTVCPHLACAVDFDPTRRKFVCPCHNSVFQMDGGVVSGPAPRAMDELESHEKGGELYVKHERFRAGLPGKVKI